MKVAIALILLTFVIYVNGGQPCGSTECRDDECCTGGHYHRYCRGFADEGLPCEVPNKFHEYRTSCPCKEGMFCSVIRRCQKEE
ncbi:U19-ctenitoxin-Pn1a-like [Uloborus diversus]|uniref:U19-ctenitoxin-Pn1a-like n=1 Tax=Uloborus diversus TaxID=327109 RepID=UPI00240A40D0|nr:U19-ctenitoxin-Pn1a-like [Uloborus diversus]